MRGAPAANGGAIWVPQGAAPAFGGGVEGIRNGEVGGAIQAIVAHPSNPDVVYIGAVNGGVWRTVNARTGSPAWTALTDTNASLSISSLDLDLTDLSFNTLVAGVGRYSSLAFEGGALSGLLRTVDGGATWSQPAATGLPQRDVSGIVSRGTTIVVALDRTPLPSIYRSVDGGASFTRAGGGLPVAPGTARTLIGHPTTNNVLFTGIYGPSGGSAGIFTSADTGLTWTKISDATMDTMLTASAAGGGNIKIAVCPAGAIFVGIVTNDVLGGVFRTTDNGTTWTAMDLPTTQETGAAGAGPVGIHPGAQGSIHFALVADPVNTNLVYIAGDRQPMGFNDTGSFPNSIGANEFSGRAFRGDASRAAGSQWVHLTHSNSQGAAGGGTANNSAPHADTRGMVFDASGTILLVCDGGIFRRTSPADNTGDWFSMNGSLQVFEYHSIAYDSLAHVVIGGAQDNGTARQNSAGSPIWTMLQGGDGADVAVDNTSFPGLSVVYYSSQNLGGFARTTFDANGVAVSNSLVGLNVISGASLQPQFVTPIKLNSLVPSRMVIAGANSVYESLDRGDTLTEIGPGVAGGNGGINGNAFAYGGSAAGVANPEVLYVAGQSGIYVRTAAGVPLTRTGAAIPGTAALDVALVPTNWPSVFAINASRVFYSTNSGGAWADITGSLTGVGSLRCVRHGPASIASHVLVGSGLGVYARSAQAYTHWFQVGRNLPHATVSASAYKRAL